MTKDMTDFCLTGIDIGSTTAKVVIYDGNGSMIFSRYCRHNARTVETIRQIFKEAQQELGDIKLDLAVTGSAGMGAAEIFGLPFVQEVVASACFIKKYYPNVRTFVEIGGEDSKIIFFDTQFRPDIRMNGSCAGGTGAFIDQMAALLNVDVMELNTLAKKAENIYPIASRCGVFAKTDIQDLLSRHVSKEDIAASVFHSVALQVITALSHGRDIDPKILIGGGPLTFYPELRKAFKNVLKIDNPGDLIIPDRPELIPAMGAAINRESSLYQARISEVLKVSKKGSNQKINNSINFVPESTSTVKRLPPLFKNKIEVELWQERHNKTCVSRINIEETRDKKLFLGIDSGSTTTKIVVTDEQGRFVIGHYGANNGNPIQAVKEGLSYLKGKFLKLGFLPHIVRTVATGYGEGLIKSAFGLNDGVVETMAHYQAAKRFDPDVSFILDIGGQDMKAIFIRDHAISDIQVNEACSSGCGSFIETFAHSLGHTTSDFATIACEKNAPFDLGTRCTVFMNSRVKQALRENASVSDISAGLAYSVIKNALYKVLKLKNTAELGNKIVVQGGTFRNQAVLRALELLLDKKVVRSDISELMGAYGSALTAINNHRLKPNESIVFNGIENPDTGTQFSKKEIRCNGCENQCAVLKLIFSNGNHFFTGNRCEKYFSNNAKINHRGENLITEQTGLLFDRNMKPEGDPILTYGIPRCLNMYENFPFWNTFLTFCGFKVVLSSPSNFKLYEKGAPSVMSENICFPAKLAHGHIVDLIEKKVGRIFYPTVVYEQEEYSDALNSFNCPVVTGYPDLLKSAVNPNGKYNIPLDNPPISFKNSQLLKKQLYHFFKQFSVNFKTVSKGVEQGFADQKAFKKQLKARAKTLINKAKKEGRMVIVLAGRPYHIDPLINHGIGDFLTELGVDVISENAVPHGISQALGDVSVLTQWGYVNRLYGAAEWVAKNRNVQLVQLTSFGCGPDAVSADEVREIIRGSGKVYTLIKMDEIANLGAVKIRLRSMLEAIKENITRSHTDQGNGKKANRIFMQKDRGRTLIAPYFSPFYSSLIPAAFRPLGYRVDILPPQDRASVELGLKAVNNDMCYPTILVAGDIIKAFKSGRYDPCKTGVILTQTGGQCRASSYVSLIKKGLADADLADVPVISISAGEINHQPGFVINEKELVKRLGLGVIFADPLARMYLSTIVREEIPGTSAALHAKYLSRMEPGIEKADYHYLLNLLKRAVDDFNRVRIKNKPVPKIGIVGEIFVKYNFFSNGNIIEWLSDQGVEVVLPSLQSFFAQRFVNESFNQKAFFKFSPADNIKTRLLEIYANYHLFRIDRVMQDFRFYRKHHSLKNLAENTSEVVSLANQFGEGWLLTAEMIAMLNERIGNIVCLQPFGCIANHITGRGVEKKLKVMFPYLHLLSLDMDAGVSEVNVLNRLHFMVDGAKEEMAHGTKTMPQPEPAGQFAIPHFLPGDLNSLTNYIPLEVEKWKSWVSGLELRKKAGSFIHR
ncbi:acyl-CoA dehydratase activase-related protein [Desulfobacula sp.]|uniref:acyl-CoA dehydratase activase-related protein n=1 Tax=Desulfobacula sp. TaxID=2593537 RepID=UPI0026059FED|nr:acyl-CoA dehydratase activase-related protein [Desulfobacula sp.]